MANLKILKDKEQKFFKEKFEDILFFKHNNTQVKLVGLIREKPEKIEKVYLKFSLILIIFLRNTRRIFCNIEDGKNLKISLSYSCPRFYFLEMKINYIYHKVK